MTLNEEIKELYRQNNAAKELILKFPDLDLTLGNTNIISESMELKESVMEGSQIEIIGCISSQFKIKIRGNYEKLEDERINAYIKAGGKSVSLFKGVVQSAVRSDDRNTTEITAYDALYEKGDEDVTDWYNETFPKESSGKTKTLGEILKSFMKLLDIPLSSEMLTNDFPFENLSMRRKPVELEELKALDFLKNFCQINGSFGIINRSGKFELRAPQIVDPKATKESTVLPSSTTFPSDSMFPETTAIEDGGVEIEPDVEVEENYRGELEEIKHYRSISYESFATKGITQIVLRDTEQSKKTRSGTGKNRYIIQGNLFVYGLDDFNRQSVADILYKRLAGFRYRPYDSANNGLPYLECGLDVVSYRITDYSVKSGSAYRTRIFKFPLLSRTLTGIQSLKDNYVLEGERNQRMFITDVQTSISTAIGKDQTTGSGGGGNGKYLTYQTPGEVGQMAVSDGNGGVTWKSFGFSAPTGGYEYNDYNKEKNVFMQFNANYASGGYRMIIGHSDADLSTFTFEAYEGYEFHFASSGGYVFRREIIIYEGKVIMTNCEEISSGKRGFMVSEDMLTWTFIEDVPKKINGIDNCYWSRSTMHCVGKNMIVTLRSSDEILLINPSNFEPIDTETQIILPLGVNCLCFTGDTFFGLSSTINGKTAMLVSQDCYKWDIVTVEIALYPDYSLLNNMIWARGKILSGASSTGYFVLADKESSQKISIPEKLGLKRNYGVQFAYNNSTKKFILMTYNESHYYTACVYQSDDGIEWELVKSYPNSFGKQHILCIDNTYILYSEKGIVYTKDFESFQASTILNNSGFSFVKISNYHPMLYFTNDGFQHD